MNPSTFASKRKAIENLRLQSVHIERGIEKVIKSLDNVTANLSVTKADGVKKFDEDTEVLQHSLDDLIKILTRGTEKQKKLLEDCETIIKETMEYSCKFIGKSPANTEISLYKKEAADDDPEYDIDDEYVNPVNPEVKEIEDCESIDSDSVAALILSSYQLLNKAPPKLL